MSDEIERPEPEPEVDPEDVAEPVEVSFDE